jgi:hypothetical protein
MQPLKLCPWIGKLDGVKDRPPSSNGEVKSMDLEIKKEYFIIYTDWYSRQDFKTGQEY